MRLLLRFYDVDSGRVLINGRDVRSIKQQSLRKEIGVVAQDTVRRQVIILLQICTRYCVLTRIFLSTCAPDAV